MDRQYHTKYVEKYRDVPRGENLEITSTMLEPPLPTKVQRPMVHQLGKTKTEERDMTDMTRDETTQKLEQELLDKVTEGTNAPANTQNFTPFLSVDKRLFGRIQEELTNT